MHRALRTLGLASAIVVVGAGAGLATRGHVVVNAFAAQPFEPPRRFDSACSAGPLYSVQVELDDVKAAIDGGAFLIDARPWEVYEAGHLPGAISVPVAHADAALPAVAASVPKDAPVVVYCRGVGCPDSANLAQCLVDEGYRDVRVYKGGFHEWSRVGMPVDGTDGGVSP